MCPFLWLMVAPCHSEQRAGQILAPAHSSARCFKHRQWWICSLSQLLSMLASFCLAEESYKVALGECVSVACNGKEKYEIGSIAHGLLPSYVATLEERKF